MVRLFKLQLNQSKFEPVDDRNGDPISHFSKASLGLQNITKLFIALFVTPVLVVSDLFSSQFILSIAGLFLAVGYLINFGYRIYKKDISPTEAAITIVGLVSSLVLLSSYVPTVLPILSICVPVIACALIFPILIYNFMKGDISLWKRGAIAVLAIGLIVAAVYLFPALLSFTSSVSVISILNITSYVTVTINTFFVVKEILIPPFKKLLEKTYKFFYEKITGNKCEFTPSYNPKLLNLNYSYNGEPDDRAALNLLFMSVYGDDIYGDDSRLLPLEKLETKISGFNNVLILLREKVNYYKEHVFGSLRFNEEISALQTMINEMTQQGKLDKVKNYLVQEANYEEVRLRNLRSMKTDIESLVSNAKKTFGNNDINTVTDSVDEYNSIGLNYFDNFKKCVDVESCSSSSNEVLEVISSEIEDSAPIVDKLKKLKLAVSEYKPAQNKITNNPDAHGFPGGVQFIKESLSPSKSRNIAMVTRDDVIQNNENPIRPSKV